MESPRHVALLHCRHDSITVSVTQDALRREVPKDLAPISRTATTVMNWHSIAQTSQLPEEG